MTSIDEIFWWVGFLICTSLGLTALFASIAAMLLTCLRAVRLSGKYVTAVRMIRRWERAVARRGARASTPER